MSQGFRCPLRRCEFESTDPADFYFHKSGVHKGRVGCCKSCAKAKAHKYRAENSERIKANKRKWNAKNPERHREYRVENSERIKADKRKWYAENPGYSRAYRQTSKGKAQYQTPKRRADMRLAQKRRLACRPRWPNARQLLHPAELERLAIMRLTGLMIEDDHIVQLQPRPVVIEGFGKVRPWTGLDVPWNLQHLTCEDHKAKHSGNGHRPTSIRLNRHGEVVSFSKIAAKTLFSAVATLRNFAASNGRS